MSNPRSEVLNGYTVTVQADDNHLAVTVQRNKPGVEMAGPESAVLIRPKQVAEALSDLIVRHLARDPYEIDTRHMTVEVHDANALSSKGEAEIIIDRDAGNFQARGLLVAVVAALDEVREFEGGRPNMQLGAKLKEMAFLTGAWGSALEDRDDDDDDELGEDAVRPDGDGFLLDADEAPLLDPNDADVPEYPWIRKVGDAMQDAVSDDMETQSKQLAAIISAVLPLRLSRYDMVLPVMPGDTMAIRDDGVHHAIITRLEHMILRSLEREPRAGTRALRLWMVQDVATILGEHLNLRITPAQVDDFFDTLSVQGISGAKMDVEKEPLLPLTDKECGFARHFGKMEYHPGQREALARKPMDLEHEPRFSTPGKLYSLDEVQADELLARRIADAIVPDIYEIARITGRDHGRGGGDRNRG